MFYIRIKPILIILQFCILIYSGCAKQGFPPGGPIDKVPPEVVRVIPDQGAVFVDPDVRVSFWFSESLQPSSVERAVFITPFQGDGVKIKIKGRRLTIKFPEPLKRDVTYVITLGTEIKDYHGNPMSSSFTLAFSTGEKLDEGEISGRVFGKSSAFGVGVWAYRLIDSEDIDPTQKTPDYIVQCEEGGDFIFTHLSQGVYRVFAVLDRAGDMFYQPGEDDIGITFEDVVISDTTGLKADSVFFQMFREDTTLPLLSRAVQISRNHLLLQFSEPVLSDKPLSEDLFRITLSEDTTTDVAIFDAYQDPKKKHIIHIVTKDLLGQSKYRVSAVGLHDEQGNILDNEYNTILFSGNSDPDTTSPRIVEINPGPQDVDVSLAVNVCIVFNEPMDSSGSSRGLTVKDTLDRVLDGLVVWQNPQKVTFLPAERLKSQTEYIISIKGEYLRDLAGNSIIDTVCTFKTINKDTLSSIEGVVYDPDSCAVGRIFVTVRQAESNGISYSDTIPGPGEYRIEDILPGLYILECFRDEDGNGIYSNGRPRPFKPAERFVIDYADTIKVRSRWPNEGNDIRLPGSNKRSYR